MKGQQLVSTVLLGKVVPALVVLALVFAPGGEVRWARGWALLGVVIVIALTHQAYVRRKNPELLEARKRVGEGTPKWDLVWNPLWWLFLFSAPSVAGVQEHRFGVAPGSWWLAAPGVLLIALGFTVSARAMAVNRHFEGTVRIQKERDHHVVDSGPYRVVRHPGYVGLGLWALGQPLVLGSSWAVVPALVAVAWLVLRTGLEDAFLRRELAGYVDYARRVRWRLVPGLW